MVKKRTEAEAMARQTEKKSVEKILQNLKTECVDLSRSGRSPEDRTRGGHRIAQAITFG